LTGIPYRIIAQRTEEPFFCYKIYKVNERITEYCNKLCKGENYIICGTRTDEEIDILMETSHGGEWLFFYVDEDIEKFKNKIMADPILMIHNLEVFFMRRSRKPQVIRNKLHDILFSFY